MQKIRTDQPLFTAKLFPDNENAKWIDSSIISWIARFDRAYRLNPSNRKRGTYAKLAWTSTKFRKPRNNADYKSECRLSAIKGEITCAFSFLQTILTNQPPQYLLLSTKWPFSNLLSQFLWCFA